MTSLAVRRPAANTTSIREGYVSSPRRNIYSASVNLSVKVLNFVKSGGLPFTEDTTEPFSGISWTFFPGIKLSSGIGTVIPLSQST